MAFIREIKLNELRSPALVLDVDVDREHDGHPRDVSRYSTAWCLIRRGAIPVAIRCLDLDGDATIDLNLIRGYFAGKPLLTLADPPSPIDATLTVVICTRDRSKSLLRALESLTKQSDSDFDVLVIDNSANGDVMTTLGDVTGLSVRCLHEPIAGLSRARNRALRDVTSELIAWLDDDEVADPEWIASLRRGFGSDTKPDAVAGVMLPAELETGAQVDWERYGGHLKGRGLEPMSLRAGAPPVIDPIYPRPIFGSGGNMAFRTTKLRQIGGFDNRLGAGTLTRGGEDTKALSMILDSGSSILHWPPALVWHFHRRSEEDLEIKLFGNSAGLGAFYMSLISTSPVYVWRIAKLLPRGVKDFFSHTREVDTFSLPENLSHASRRGLVRGPWLFVKEARRQRRASKT